MSEPQDIYRRQLSQQLVPMDFGDEVLYGFGYLPENKKLNDEIYKRAIERARRKAEQREKL